MSQALSSSTDTSADVYRQSTGPATYLFWLLWFANFINYVDRFALGALLPQIQKEFMFSDTEAGLLATSFLFVYTVAILPAGITADRIKRKFVVAFGIAVWSIITAVTAVAQNFGVLFATRAALGFGEGTYFPPSTSMLASVYPTKDRAKVMSRWNTGLLTGAAVGTVGATTVYSIFNDWRPVFLLFGIPGLILALLILRVKEPPREATGEEASAEMALAREGLGGLWRTITDLMRIHTLRVTVWLQTLTFFVFGATSLFLTKLIEGAFGITPGLAGTISGGVLVLGGIAGLLSGGFVADRLIVRYPGARVLVSGWGILLAVPAFIVAVLSLVTDFGLGINVRLYGIFVPAFFLTVALLQVNSGPLTAVSQDVVPVAQRAAAVGVTLMLSHFLGDLFSPTIVGFISDTLKTQTMNSFWVALGLTKTNSLGFAFLMTCVPALLIAGIIGIVSSRGVKKDLDTVGEKINVA